MDSLKTFGIGDVKIVCDPFSYDKKPEMRAFIESPEVNHLIEAVGKKFIMVLGGDGTMLRAVQSHYLEGLPFLGINFGSKGFLLNDRAYLKGDNVFESVAYPLLQIQIQTEDGSYEHVAFNEAQIKTSGGHIVDLGLTINNHSHIRLRGDGLLIVTPAGSTGYNASAWGPRLPHSSSHFIATPLLTFDPRHIKPIVYENEYEARIRNNNERQQAISVYADSVPVVEKYSGEIEIMVRKYSQSVELLISKNYRPLWDAKVFAEQGMEILSNTRETTL